MEQAPVCARPDLVDNIGLKIDVERARNVFARRSLREESTEAFIVGRGRILRETAVRLVLNY